MILTSDDEVWFWYTAIKHVRDNNLRISKWCAQNKVEESKMWSMIYRIEWKSISDPDNYKELMRFVRQYCDIPPINARGHRPTAVTSEFLRRNPISKKELENGVTHLSYLNLIDRLKSERGEPKFEPQKPNMNFIEVPTLTLNSGGSPVPVVPIDEQMPSARPVIEPKQNDIELIVSKGIRVIVSPSIDSLKIVKIIELLKDI